MKKELTKLKEELIDGNAHSHHAHMITYHTQSSDTEVSLLYSLRFSFVLAAIREELAKSSSA